ncbi:MAG: polynucleotide adenylyltransferase [Clostridia bacterium]|nr:polynucleotide adenylyltransferase [Clostridia bacterium]
MNKITAPREVLVIMEKLRRAGHGAYLVGGCVRDSLLGKTPHDYDVTTDASPDRMKEVFRDDRTVETGIRHGTLTVISEGVPVEVTSFRIDGEYRDGRRPESVSFTTDIALDLSRRDFTVNAMAYSEESGLIDLFSGVRHLEEKKIVTVGDPDDRFSEDGLRVLRALRFASCLDFTVGEETAEAVRRSVPLLLRVSAERIRTELMKLLAGPGAERIARDFSGVVGASAGVSADAAAKAAGLFGKTEPDPLTRLALIYLSAGLSPREAGEKAAALKPSRAEKDAVVSALSAASAPMPTATPAVRRLVGGAGLGTVRRAAEIRSATGDPDAEKTARLAEEIVRRGDPVKISDLTVGGKEMIDALGVEGEKIGEILSRLLFLVTEDEVRNEPGELLAAAKQIIEKN